jgi:hypothetical protein
MRSSGWRGRSRTLPACSPKLPRCVRASRPWKTCRPTATCRSTCSTELVRQLPDGVYITTMKQLNQVVTIQGVAQSNERVSELLRNLANNSDALADPSRAGGNRCWQRTLGPREQRRVSNFNIRVQLMRASEVKGAASAPAAGPVGGACRLCAKDLTPWLHDRCPKLTLPRCRRRWSGQFRKGLDPNDPSVMACRAALRVVRGADGGDRRRRYGLSG